MVRGAEAKQSATAGQGEIGLWRRLPAVVSSGFAPRRLREPQPSLDFVYGPPMVRSRSPHPTPPNSSRKERTSRRSAEAGLRVQAKPERLAALLSANQQFAQQDQSEAPESREARRETADPATTVFGRLEPVYQEMEQLDQQGHAVRRAAFAQVATAERRSGYQDIYAELQRMGLLSFRSPARANKRPVAESGGPIPDFG